MDRMGSLKRLNENIRGDRRRHGKCTASGLTKTRQSKFNNQTKKRKRDDTSPEKD